MATQTAEKVTSTLTSTTTEDTTKTAATTNTHDTVSDATVDADEGSAKKEKGASDKEPSKAATDASGTDPSSTQDAAAKDDDKKKAQSDSKDIRRHPKYAFIYEVRKYNDLYHVVDRLGSVDKSRGLVKRVKGQYRELRRQLPLLLRFSKETLPKLGRRRILASILGNLILNSFIPIAQHRAHNHLTEVTIAAMNNRKMDWLEALKAVVADIGSYALKETLSQRIDDNKAKLAYKYSNHIRERLIEARLELDSVTTANEKVIGQFRSAEKLLARRWDSSFIITHASNIVSEVVNLVNDILLVRKVAASHGSRLITWSFAINLFFVIRRYTKFLRWGSRSVTAITDENFRRADIMSKASSNADAQDQVLGLRQYYYEEYKKARQLVGDASPNEPDTWDDSISHPWRTIIYKMIDKINTSALCLLFAMHIISQPSQTIADASTAMNDLTILQHSTWQISYHVYSLLRHGQSFFDNLTSVERFYSLENIAPLLKRRAAAIPYQKRLTDIATADPKPESGLNLDNAPVNVVDESARDSVQVLAAEPVKAGMKIEFVNVSFTYPHKYKKALDNVSFKIEAGQLCSIVGFSGSGKSTLIALLVRLHDPDAGRILINDIDIADYDPDELYKAISFLFQTTRKASLTIREFIRLGRLGASDEELEAAVKESGANEIVNKFKKGLDTELEARHLWDRAITVEMLVKRAQQNDEHIMEWRGQGGGDYDDLEDETEDPRTDEDLRQVLEKGLTLPGGVQTADARWTTRASKEELPAPPGNEEVILSDGYDYKTAEEEEKKNQHDSASFSGGEWSKIVLARSFLRNQADLLILDEFSASLDPLSEADIFDKFMKKRGQRTIIAVTHRFHLAYRSDIILFLQDGQLKEKGTHHELMRIGGKYKEMYLKTTNSSGKEVACQTDSRINTPENSDAPPKYENKEDSKEDGAIIADTKPEIGAEVGKAVSGREDETAVKVVTVSA